MARPSRLALQAAVTIVREAAGDRDALAARLAGT